MPFTPKKGFALRRHLCTGPSTLCIYSWMREITNCLERNHTMQLMLSTRHDTCYRDTPAGKRECDRKMLTELNTLVPKDKCANVDRQLVRSIIGLKHRMRMGIANWCSQLADELHKPVRRRFAKRTVFAKPVDDIWTDDEQRVFLLGSSWLTGTQSWRRSYNENKLPRVNGKKG